jgi:hypothetical protein
MAARGSWLQGVTWNAGAPHWSPLTIRSARFACIGWSFFPVLAPAMHRIVALYELNA